MFCLYCHDIIFVWYINRCLKCHTNCTVMRVIMPYLNFYPYSGFIVTYVLLQLSFWWIMHTMFIMWSILFPFHFKNTARRGRAKYFLLVALAVGIVLPFIPFIAAQTTGGFTYGMIIPPLCSPVELAVTYYSLVLPISIMLVLGVSMMAVVLRTIMKVSIVLLFVVHYNYNLLCKILAETGHHS